MKKTFTKLFSTVALLSLLFIGQSARSQTVLAAANTNATPTAIATVADESKTDSKADDKKAEKKADEPAAWTPVRRVWGYSFGDFYYNSHADAANRGAETNYNGVPTYRNAFQIRRVYLGYDYDIDQKFSAELLLASEPGANTGVNGTTAIQNGDNLVDNKMAFFIKNIDLRWKGVWSGTDFVIGEMSTPSFPLLTEKIWGYRAIEKTVADFHKTNSYDVGVALQGVFDPATKNYGYDVMIGNNSQASLLSAGSPNTGFFKAFYGDVYGKFMNQTIIVDLYADYMKTASRTSAVLGPQARNMVKGFVAYTTPKITFGVEAYTQKIANGVTNSTTHAAEDATVNAFSVYTHGTINPKLGFFARYDGYNPDTDYSEADTYTNNTNLSSYNAAAKERFVTAGLDFTPTKNVHFEPNLWFIQYQDQRPKTAAGYVPDSHVLVYRLTFFFTFGK